MTQSKIAWSGFTALALGCGGMVAPGTTEANGGFDASSVGESALAQGGAGTNFNATAARTGATSAIYGVGGSPVITAAPGGSYSVVTPNSMGGVTSYTVVSTSTGKGGAISSSTAYGKGGGTSVMATYSRGGGTSTSSSAYGKGGGTSVTVISITPYGACTGSTDLMTDAASSVDGDWIGGDFKSSADDPCGVQGSIYAYSDNGLDSISGSGDETLMYPKAVGSTDERYSPCVGGKCCISGMTSLWPTGSGGQRDYEAGVWGAGIGIALSDPGDGSAKRAYKGPARGFIVTLSGYLSEGHVLRFGYAQSAVNDAVPFREFRSLGRLGALFDDVYCPAWAESCIDPTGAPFDLQIQIIGGDVGGKFEICIDSITPIVTSLL